MKEVNIFESVKNSIYLHHLRDNMKYLNIQYLKTFLFRTKIRCTLFPENRFRMLSIFHYLVTLLLIFIALNWNYFHEVDISAYFTTVWSMFGSILALLITIHFFYIQNFSNYVPLAFIFDANRDKKPYVIIGIIWASTLWFLFLWANHYLILKSCPDNFLLPISIFIESLVVWLVFYFFHVTNQNLSPSWILENIERYFLWIIHIVKRNEKFLLDYAKSTGVTEGFEHKSKFDSDVGMGAIVTWWYRLETLFDGAQKLVWNKEYTLSRDYLRTIGKCFWYLIDAHGKIAIKANFEYFGTYETEIDKWINRYFERVESSILMEIKSDSVYGILEGFNIYENSIKKLIDINYSTSIPSNENPLLERAILRYLRFFDKILELNNEEWIFQWKEGATSLYKVFVPKKIGLNYIDSIFDKLDLVVAWEISRKKSIEIYKSYSQFILLLIANNPDKYTPVNLNELIRKHLKFIIEMNKIMDTSWFTNKLVQDIWTWLSINLPIILNILANENESNKKELSYLSRIEETIMTVQSIFINWADNWIEFDNFLSLFVRDIWWLLSRSLNLNISVDESLFDATLKLISSIISKWDIKLLSSFYVNKFILDVLCWIGLYWLDSGNPNLFTKSLEIFDKLLLKIYSNEFWRNLNWLEYYCYWLLFAQWRSLNEISTWMITQLVIVLEQRFRKQTWDLEEQYVEYIRQEMIVLINNIKDLFEDDWFRWIPDEETLSKVYLANNFPDFIIKERLEQLMLLILGKCWFLIKR